MFDVTRKGSLSANAALLFRLFNLLVLTAMLAVPTRGAQAAPNYLHTSGNRIVDASGAVVGLSGLNWFGFETTNNSPHGLWARNLGEMLDQIQGLGYNTIRLPFSNAMLDPGVMPTGIDYGKNPDLAGLTALQVMDRVIAGAGARGIRVILDNHRSTAGAGPESNGLWYTSQYPESRWIADWKMLAQRYKGNDTVVGMDLRNEPHAACWGCGDSATDWRLAAERAGNAVLSVNPDLLIIVEGVGVYNGQGTWWGGNLLGARDFPMRLNVPNRLVYSPHEYPASVFPQTWFNDPAFPDNLPAVWDNYWGYLAADTPILIGEFGTKLETEKDRQWFQKFQGYIQEKQLNWTFWSLNPNSGDTGGLLLDDWLSVHQEKQSVLRTIQYPLIGSGSPPLIPTAASSPTPVPTATQAPPTPTAVPTATQPSQAGSTLVLDNFESGSVAAWSRFAGGNSSITAKAVSPGQSGIYAMRVDYNIGSGGWAGVGRNSASGQDWSGYQTIGFAFYGANSGRTIRFEILDNRAAGGSGDTSERFEYKFNDSFSGWRTFDLPWSAFTRRSDWQPDGAPNDGFNRTAVWGYNFSPLSGQGSFQLDQIQLSKTSSAGVSTLLADFESGSTGPWSTFRDGNSTIAASAVAPGRSSQYAMQVHYGIAAGGWAGSELRYTQAQDWSGSASFDFWFYGTNSGNVLRLEVYENRSNQGSDTSERFEFRFVDNSTGWKQITIPWSSFTRRSDWQPDGAPNDGFSRSQIWGFNFSPLGGQGSFQVDDILLIKP